MAEGYATDNSPVIMHPIDSFAQALLDVASKPFQPFQLEVYASYLGALRGNIPGIRPGAKTWCSHLYFDSTLLFREGV